MSLLSSLHNLMFGERFNQNLENATLLSGLQILTFGYGSKVNQGLEQVILPSGLQTLTCGSGCDQGLKNVILPSGLQAFACGYGIIYWQVLLPEPGGCDPAEWPSDLDAWLRQ